MASKELSPEAIAAVFAHGAAGGDHDFTVGIEDDVTHRSIPIGERLEVEPADVRGAIFGASVPMVPLARVAVA